MEVDDLAEERRADVVYTAVAGISPGRGGEVRYDEKGAGGVGDPGEATEVGEEGDGARVAGGRRRDQMWRAEGERKRRKRVFLPHHRAGGCMRRCDGDGGGSLELRISSPVAAADLGQLATETVGPRHGPS